MNPPASLSFDRFPGATPMRKETIYYKRGPYYDPLLESCVWILTVCFCFQLGALVGS